MTGLWFFPNIIAVDREPRVLGFWEEPSVFYGRHRAEPFRFRFFLRIRELPAVQAEVWQKRQIDLRQDTGRQKHVDEPV